MYYHFGRRCWRGSVSWCTNSMDRVRSSIVKRLWPRVLKVHLLPECGVECYGEGGDWGEKNQ